MTLKLSEAIRKGIEKFPEQAFYAFFQVDEVTGEKGACALGCAIYTLFECEEGFMVDLLTETYPDLRQLDPYPVPDDFEGGGALVECLHDVIVTLNDDLKWSRERIADWLASEGL